MCFGNRFKAYNMAVYYFTISGTHDIGRATISLVGEIDFFVRSPREIKHIIKGVIMQLMQILGFGSFLPHDTATANVR